MLDDATTKNLLLIIAAIGGIVSAILAFLSKQQADKAAARAETAAATGKQTHDLVNSRMTELLAITKSSARAEGIIEGAAGTNTVPSVPIVVKK